ncbi:MAG: DNA recombination protein RmuC [Phycisphaerales bacterium]|nr:MAG: DNA recombination protein RmuC [Phycisphaerales bacterium]
MSIMNEWVLGIIGLAAGAVLGAAGAGIWLLVKGGRVRAELADVRGRAKHLQEQTEQQAAEIGEIRAEAAEINERREAAERQVATQEERVRALEEAEQRLKETFLATGTEALQANSEEFLKLAKTAFASLMTEAKGDVEKKQQAIDSLVKPIRELLEKQNAAVGEIEKKRDVAYEGIREQIRQIIESNEKLGRGTERLVTALRRPEQRGRWGEMQLRNTVELAGMKEHCDFDEQAQTDDPATRDRPDMTVHVPGGGVIVVDSKVALEAYLDAIQPDADRESQLKRHAEHVERHYKGLASKRYWEQFEKTPKLVVMFMPIESALTAALEVKPDLHADAMQNHVLIATPTVLMAVLLAVAYGWQQEDVARNAREISQVGRELYDRLSVFVSHFEKIGGGLKRASDAYDNAVGSLESRILPSSRKLKELHATTEDEISSPGQIRIMARKITAGELKPLSRGEQGES